MHRKTCLSIALGLLALNLLAACHTAHGVGEDVRSVGRVFTDHPDGAKTSH